MVRVTHISTPSRLSTCSRAEDILILSDKGEVFLYKTTTCCGYIFCHHTGRNVQVHICCFHDDLLTEEKLRKRRFLNKYHDVLHHTAHALSGMLSYLDFRLDRRKTIPYTTSGLVFFKYLNREKISVFKNISIRVDETLVKIKSCGYEEIYHTL